MKIKYKALWIDDHPESIDPDIENLSNKLEKFGFNFDVEKRETFSMGEIRDLVEVLSNYNPYDIIIFDYDLGGIKGDSLAKELRTSVYTDMIFYSGNLHGKLRKALFDNQVDGVYIVSRPYFVDEAWPIIKDQIKRICDINNMRGLILDEMSEIDLRLRDLLCEKYHSLTGPEQNKQQNKISKRIKNRIKDLKKIVEELNEVTFSENVRNPLRIEFDIVRTRLSGLLGDDIFSETGGIKNNQTLRNKFSHNKTEYDEGTGIVKLKNYPETYDFDTFTKIRKDLITIQSQLDGI